MTRFRRQPRLTDNFSQVPHGLWTADLSWGAKSLLGWLHSHDERYLSALTNNRIRSELGASGQVAGWVKELTAAGFLTVERHGQRNRFVLMAGPWEELAARKCEPADNRPVDETSDEPAENRPVTDRLPAGNQPKIGHIEYQVADQVADQHSHVADMVHDAEIIAEWETSFMAWWSMQIRKVGKDKARTAWRKLSEPDRVAALEAMPHHVQRWRSEGVAEKFIPHPVTWLNGRRWEDELDTGYKPAGSLVEQISHYALEQRRQESHERTRRDDSPRGLGSGHDRLE